MDNQFNGFDPQQGAVPGRDAEGYKLLPEGVTVTKSENRMEYAPDIPNFIRIYDSCQKNNRKYGSSRISGCLYQLILIFILMPEFLSRKQRFFHICSLRKTVPGNVLLQELLLPALCPFPLKYL